MVNVTLFLPSRIYGGAERQFALLAEFLHYKSDVNLIVIDSQAGIVAGIVDHLSGITVLTFVPNQKITVTNSILVTPASYMFTVGNMLDLKDCDVRYWFLAPLNLPNMFIASKFKGLIGLTIQNVFKFLYLKKIQRLEGQLYFMHKDPQKMVEDFYGVSFNSPIMSALVDLGKPKNLPSLHEFKEGHFAWLGRLDKSSKFFAVRRLMSDLKMCNNCIFHIIGDGNGMTLLMNIAKEYDVMDRVIFHGHIEYERLHEVLGFCQVVFTHGTSIYEGVRCNIPTVVFDFFLEDEGIDVYRYQFYNERIATELGTIVKNPYLKVFTVGNTLREVMTITADDRKRELIVTESLTKAKKIINNDLRNFDTFFKSESLVKDMPVYSSYIDIFFWKFRNLVKSKFFNP